MCIVSIDVEQLCILHEKPRAWRAAGIFSSSGARGSAAGFWTWPAVWEPCLNQHKNIREAEIDQTTGDKKNKPYYAFKQFFDLDGAPKEKELKYIEAHPKLQQIFKEIYGKEPKM